jgi:signal transduction histidine kinase
VNTASAQPASSRAWLRPSDAALLALADDDIGLGTLRRDPGMVLHFLRYARPTPLPDTFTLDATAFTQPGLCETAAALLEREPNPDPVDAEALAHGLALAEITERIATETGQCSPDAAWCVGLLAGYFAERQAEARKLLARWRLPAWVTVAVGFQDLPVADGVKLGGHTGVLEVLQSGRAERREPPVASPEPTPDGVRLATPNPLWPRLLRLAAKARARSAAQLVAELEDRIDALTDALVESREDFATALRDAKLDGLAEFAAGAGHEINNPLAVIATNVQLLRSEEDDVHRLDRYEAVLRQTRRIHDILAGTRQFARPPEPHPLFVTPNSWVPLVADDLLPLAATRGVVLHLPEAGEVVRVWADASHLRVIVLALGRNAIEAAGQGGWARIHLDPAEECVRVVVDDSGPGPSTAAVPHLFDPFFCGRDAGRGRGLGLSVAWRLAKQNAGDVRYERTPNGPTRFVLTLPSEPAPEYLSLSGRKSA